MTTTDVYLPIKSTTEWICALSIPRADIGRLTLRPLKWLRFATFAVCGAKGHLSTTQGGEMVDYENVSLEDLVDKYYYIPDGVYHLVDCNAFDDNSPTPRRSNFRDKIRGRDDNCVITKSDIHYAVHIIPRSKGNEYITFVVRDRSSVYEQLPFSLKGDVDIDCIENGILLSPDLHGKFDLAEIVFLKTPNFAMAPADVPLFEQASIPDNRTTLQYIVPPTGRFPVPPYDVSADWSRNELPPPASILLDFMYGAAVAKRWKCDHLHDLLEERFEADFSKVLAENPRHSTPEDDTSSEVSQGLLDAMDYVLFLPMLLKGITPQSIIAEQERRNKEEELRAQKQSHEKVQQWLDSDASECHH